jgi:hypothetical protein
MDHQAIYSPPDLYHEPTDMCHHGHCYDRSCPTYDDTVINTYRRVVDDEASLKKAMEGIRAKASDLITGGPFEELKKCQQAGDIVARELRENQKRLERYEERLQDVFAMNKPRTDQSDATLYDPYCY